ncbi:MAG: cyanophycin synthetase, partial [Candidatus Muiribacteriota bacterium]
SPIISKNNKIEFYEKDFIFDGKTYFEYGNPVLEISKINLVGKHNYQNISYALKVSRLLEIDTELIINALENFKPVEHRIEYCGKYNNIEFYNDSKSTTFESTYAAIESFEKPVHLILSGVKKKGMNVKEFYFNIKKNKNVVKILIFGKICEEYKEFVTEPDILYNSYDWELFLKKYINEIENNSIILFSPGMPSFDYFTNFEHRGKFFKQVVAKLIKDS